MQRRYKATKARATNSNRLVYQKNELETEDHEEYHEVEAGITAEGFIDWAIPRIELQKKIQIFIPLV